jgi:hypothetical protein
MRQIASEMSTNCMLVRKYERFPNTAPGFARYCLPIWLALGHRERFLLPYGG